MRQIKKRSAFRLLCAGLLVGATIWNPAPASAVSISTLTGFEKAFGFKGDPSDPTLTVFQTAASSPGNAFWPGEEASCTYQFINNSDHPMKVTGKFEVVQYAMKTDPNDTFQMAVEKVKDIAAADLSIEIPAKGFVNHAAKLPIPERFGGYAVFLNVDGHPKRLLTHCIRVPKAEPGKVQHPAYALDVQAIENCALYKRIGIKATRIEWAYSDTTSKDYATEKKRLADYLQIMADNDITVMMTVSTGGDQGKMPVGQIRSLLDENGAGKMGYPGDFTMLPQYDEDFQKWCKDVTETFGWPKGPVNAIELWNEPWEGMSISGWGADMPRYRELFIKMAQGIEEGNKSAGTKVLIGGACSSMNTEDKLFGDGNMEPFLKWLDFTSIHYQPMCAQPALVKYMQERKSPNGPTRVWDTESWIANSEDRVAVALASMRSIGQSRTAGVFHDSVREVQHFAVKQPDGQTKEQAIVQSLAPGAAIAANQQLVGERQFKELLFKNGLPWVYVFDGLKGPDDGTVIIVGDLGGMYERDLLFFRNVLGLKARKRSVELRKKLDDLPAAASNDDRNALLKQLKLAEVMDDAKMTIANPAKAFLTYDFFGNPIPPTGDQLTVSLDGLGYFIRTDGSAGSFAKLLDAIRVARVEGIEPVEIVAHDLTARVQAKPTLKLTITNVLNRPIAGKLDVTLGKLQLETPSQEIKLGANETKDFVVKISGGTPTEDNSYALVAKLDAGADGSVEKTETMHSNVISKQAITVDGNLDDWKNVLPQPVKSLAGAGKNLTEKAWLPFVKFDESGAGVTGVASGFIAYDDNNFYFAAKIADATPYDGSQRFATRDEDQYYYPEKSFRIEENNGQKKLVEQIWPAGVRRFSYRKDPDLPSGDNTDNVQIGFNVLPLEKTDWLPNPPGVMPRYMCYKTTDYEYALNPVAAKYGGGTEIWRLLAPGVPRKHFYPRQPKAPKDGGPVENGKLEMKRDGNSRIVELSLPWSELPDVKKNIDAGTPFKFTFRVNDNKGPSYELNSGRSVSKISTYALHNYWATSWAVETEFGVEK